jgi:hypothetical protein
MDSLRLEREVALTYLKRQARVILSRYPLNEGGELGLLKPKRPHIF